MEYDKADLWDVGGYQEHDRALDDDGELVMMATEPVVKGEPRKTADK